VVNPSGIRFVVSFCEVNIFWRKPIPTANLRINYLETHSMSAIRQYVYTSRVAYSATLSVLIVCPLYNMCGVFSLGHVMHAGTLVLLR
jgi:hypothetical protein